MTLRLAHGRLSLVPARLRLVKGPRLRLVKWGDSWESQEREPAGTPEGGRWVGGGGASSASGGSPGGGGALGGEPASYPTGSGEAPRPGMGDIPITPDSLAKLTQRDPVTGAMPSSAAYVRPDGTFTPERQALHDSIVTAALASSTPVEDPHMVMLGGGPASGKTEMKDSGMVTLPTNTVENDPDEIKKALPETAPLQEAGDRSWAGVTHEESSYLSARITSASFETSRNMVLDSTGDSTIDKLSAKIDAAHDAGYKVDANYITVHPDTGTERAMARAEKTGREVNEDVVRNTYASISEVFPQASEKFDSVKLFDNNATAGHEGGQPRVSQGIQLIASKEPGGHLTVSDQPKYNQFLSYGRG